MDVRRIRSKQYLFLCRIRSDLALKHQPEAAEDDQFLLEINLDDVDNSTGEDQIYWLVALKTARKVWQLREARRNSVAERHD
jgi:hypothetical protein